MFSTLLSKVLGHSAKPETKPVAPTSTAPAASASAAAPSAATVPAPASPQAPAPAALPQVDVSAVLDGLAAKHPEKLDWKKSIVDLLKLVDMDSSLTARKELAKELHFTGDTSDSAKMNVWLHKEVIKQIAANGGKVPANLLD